MKYKIIMTLIVLALLTSAYAVSATGVLTLTPAAYNVYSCDMVDQGGQKCYFSGWYTVAQAPNDAIYKMSCNVPNSSYCTAPVKAISPNTTFKQLGDPTLVKMPTFWLMFMTCSTSTDFDLTDQGICFSTSWTGAIWGAPSFLMSGYWLPSATMKDGEVYLFSNSTTDGSMNMFNLGVSGVAVGVPQVVTMPYDYPESCVNIDVVYQPTISLWQAVCELNSSDPLVRSTRIDLLSSMDGVAWDMAQQGVIVAASGKNVRTPNIYNTAYYVTFGCSNNIIATANKICFQDWSQ